MERQICHIITIIIEGYFRGTIFSRFLRINLDLENLVPRKFGNHCLLPVLKDLSSCRGVVI